MSSIGKTLAILFGGSLVGASALVSAPAFAGEQPQQPTQPVVIQQPVVVPQTVVQPVPQPYPVNQQEQQQQVQETTINGTSAPSTTFSNVNVQNNAYSPFNVGPNSCGYVTPNIGVTAAGGMSQGWANSSNSSGSFTGNVAVVGNFPLNGTEKTLCRQMMNVNLRIQNSTLVGMDRAREDKELRACFDYSRMPGVTLPEWCRRYVQGNIGVAPAPVVTTPVVPTPAATPTPVVTPTPRLNIPTEPRVIKE